MQKDSHKGSDKDMANKSSFTPKVLPTPNSRLNLSPSNYSDTDSKEDIGNQILFTPKIYLLQLAESR